VNVATRISIMKAFFIRIISHEKSLKEFILMFMSFEISAKINKIIGLTKHQTDFLKNVNIP
jgi:hypothetical protein